MKIYSASSLVNRVQMYGRLYDEVTIGWEVNERSSALVDYSTAIEGFGRLGTGHARLAITELSEYFSWQEVQLLKQYLESTDTTGIQHVRLDVEEIQLPLSTFRDPKINSHQWAEERERGPHLPLHELKSPAGLPERLAQLNISGRFTFYGREPSGYTINPENRGAIVAFSKSLAEELNLQPDIVEQGVNATWARGLTVEDRTKPSNDDLPF